MKIILYKDVPNLGEEGDIKVVANGYARNFLIPRKFAVPYSKNTIKELEQKQQSIDRHKQEKRSIATSDKNKIENLEMAISLTAGEKGQLFGSVTSASIVDFLSANGIAIERKRIEIPEGGIKSVGSYEVRIKLYGGEIATMTIKVASLGETQDEASSEAPSEASSEAPSEVSSEASSEVPSEASSEVPSEASSEAPSEVSSEVPSEASSEAPSEAPSEASSEVPSEVSSEASSEVPSEVPSEASSEVQEDTAEKSIESVE